MCALKLFLELVEPCGLESKQRMKQIGEREDGNMDSEHINEHMPHNDLTERKTAQYDGNSGFGGQLLEDMEEKNGYNVYDYGFEFHDQSFQPLYVNVKQLEWIRKRKARRDLLDSLMVASENNYLHKSRHLHAMNRLRAPSGRFLTKEETREFQRKDSF